MVTRKPSKPARRSVSDEEIKTAYHDEVLNWLVDSLDQVVGRVFTRPREWSETEATAQRAEALRWIDEVCRRLESLSDARALDPSGIDRPRKTSPEVPQAADGKVAELRRWMVKPVWPALDESLGKAEVVSWEIMKPVAEVTPMPVSHRSGRSKDAGFVDLCVTLLKAESLRLEGIPEFHRYSLVHDAVADIQAVMDLTVGPLDWTAERRRCDLWISVRTGSFTLGEVLQELKTLRQLGESEHMVALCVDGISVDMATKIRHEQLFVIDRATFDLK